jgi:hypothetical protein
VSVRTLPLQVFLATWHETLVAVKLLMSTSLGMGNVEAAAETVLSQSNPVMRNLKQVGATQRVQLGGLPQDACDDTSQPPGSWPESTATVSR